MKRNVVALSVGTFVAAVVGTAMMTEGAWAENFVVDGNKALNTNNTFRRVDNFPRMSIWDFNPNDADQQFDRIQGSRGGTLLRHRSTGNCLNAHYLSNGGEVNTWSCNAGDPDQNFTITSLGNGYSRIQRTGTNLCVDSPTRDNGGKIHLWQCVDTPNQRWRSSGVIINPPPIQPPNLSLAVYRQSNPFWNAGYAPASTNPPNPKLGASKGNCTWYASGRSKELGRNANNVNKLLGNASQWAIQARNAGVATSSTPVVGAIAQWGAGNPSNSNHVAVVESVNRDGTITISESSYDIPGGRYDYLYNTRTIPANNPSIYILP